MTLKRITDKQSFLMNLFEFYSMLVQKQINISVVNVYFLLYVDLLLHKHNIEFIKSIDKKI